MSNERAVAAAIIATLSDPARAREQARQGQRLVRERYSWDAVLDRWLEVYQSCLGGSLHPNT